MTDRKTLLAQLASKDLGEVDQAATELFSAWATEEQIYEPESRGRSIPHPRKSVGIYLGIGVLATVILGLLGTRASSIAAEKSEREHVLSRSISIHRDLLTFVEDDIDRTSEIAASLAELAVMSPRYSANRSLRASEIVHVLAAQAVNSLKDGNYRAALEQVQQIRSWTGASVVSDRGYFELLTSCLEAMVYIEAGLNPGRDERASNLPEGPLRQARWRLRNVLSSHPIAVSRGTLDSRTCVVLARVHTLVALVDHKTGDPEKALDGFAAAQSMLARVPAEQRETAWINTQCRILADQSMPLLMLDRPYEAGESCSEGLEMLLASEAPSKYLQAILLGNRADVYREILLTQPSEESRHSEIENRRACVAKLKEVMRQFRTQDVVENLEVHTVRLVRCLVDSLEYEEAMKEATAFCKFHDPIAFYNFQLGPVDRTYLAVACAMSMENELEARLLVERAIFLALKQPGDELLETSSLRSWVATAGPASWHAAFSTAFSDR